MTDPIVLFLLILIGVAIAINKGASGMLKLAQDREWAGWKQSEFAWKLVLSLVVIPIITLMWAI